MNIAERGVAPLLSLSLSLYLKRMQAYVYVFNFWLALLFSLRFLCKLCNAKLSYHLVAE